MIDRLDVGFICLSILANTLNFNFEGNYSIKLTSLKMVTEAAARRAFGEVNPYESEVFFIKPLVAEIIGLIGNGSVLYFALVALIVLSSRNLSRALELTTTQTSLMSVFLYFNPFMFQMLANHDSYILDLFFMSWLAYKCRQDSSDWSLALLLAVLVYLNPQNIILFSLLTRCSGSKFILVLVKSLFMVASLLILSRSTSGSWVL